MATTAADILAAIKVVWDAATPLAGLPITRDEESVRSSPTYPYCVITTPVSVRERTTNTSEVWRHVFEFAVYATTAAIVEGWVDKIATALDAASYSLGSGKGSVVRRRRMAEAYGSDDKAVWRGGITYEVLRQKAKTD